MSNVCWAEACGGFAFSTLAPLLPPAAFLCQPLSLFLVLSSVCLPPCSVFFASVGHLPLLHLDPPGGFLPRGDHKQRVGGSGCRFLVCRFCLRLCAFISLGFACVFSCCASLVWLLRLCLCFVLSPGWPRWLSFGAFCLRCLLLLLFWMCVTLCFLFLACRVMVISGDLRLTVRFPF